MVASRDFSNFANNGYLVLKQTIPVAEIKNLKQKILQLMLNYVELSDDEKKLTNAIDIAFQKITLKSAILRSNIYKTIGHLLDIPLMAGTDLIRDKLEELGFGASKIQSFSIYLSEPNTNKFLFKPHQDLKGKASNKSVLIWIPLSEGLHIGGVGLKPYSHLNGPQKHQVINGYVQLKDLDTKTEDDFLYENWKLGDCIIFDPLIHHWSIPNCGTVNRWTAILKLDEVTSMSHLENSLTPFDASEYTDITTNEERIGSKKTFQYE